MPTTMKQNVRLYTTKELSPKTWPDFEALFAKYGGVQAGCWCMFYHRSHPIESQGLTLKERAARNRRDKKLLVKKGKCHGILVYAEGQPVGWCQYGPKEELPRIDAGRKYRKLTLPITEKKLWRVTCFFVDKDYRRKGAAKVALKAVLASIRKRGGGVVEAYPATHHRAVAVWFGTVPMLRREGFKAVSAFGKSNVVMRRSI